MAGHPGSGKSVIAREVARATGAVLLDKDVVKSPMVEQDVPEQISGPLAYEVFLAVGRSIVEQGFSVVLDSPAYYPIIVEKGKAMAEATGAGYFIIEAVLSDRDELERRLRDRESMPSQIDFIVEDPYSRPGAGQISEPRLELDTSGSPEACVAQALRYIGRTKR
jgi:predicted kinase